MNNKINKVAIFDFDNTLIKSNACLEVKDLKGNVVARFYNDSFRNYTLQPNEYLDFQAFESPESLKNYQELPLMNKYREYLQRDDVVVTILTSRSDIHVVDDFLNELGCRPDLVIGVNAPGLAGLEYPDSVKTNAEKKKWMIEQKFVLNGFKDFIYYDDDIANLEAVGSIENINIKTILA